MVFIYLFFAHFVADFLLQPAKLVDWKNRSWLGVFVHASVHFLMAFLLLLIHFQNINALFVALMIGVVHFFIDLSKACHEKNITKYQFSYWIDQIFHYLSIILVSTLAVNFFGFTASSIIDFKAIPLLGVLARPEVLIYLTLAIFATFTIEYSFLQKTRNLKNYQYRIDWDYFVKRLFIVTLLFLGGLFASIHFFFS